MARINRPSIALLLLHVITRSHAAPQVGTVTTTTTAATATFTANPNIGPGGSSFTDSAHFRIYDGASSNAINNSLTLLEGAFDCFISTLGWRSSGLSFNDDSDSGSLTKTNVYSVATLPGAAGVMHSDATTGMGYLEVQNDYLAVAGVVVHEFGHVMHYHQKTWVNQGRTGAWWETVANWVADTFKTSDLCAESRTSHGIETAATSEIEVVKLLGDSFQVLVDGTADSGNYYQAWPFLTYLTNNPDGFVGLGRDTLKQLMVQYEKDSNETPLHTLDRVATNATVAEIVGRYWARMAYLDIGHPLAQQVFFQQRSNINYTNVDATENGYNVKSARKPQYMGANIIPLNATSGANVDVKVTANGGGAFTATLAVRNTSSNSVRYVNAPVDGSGSTTIAEDEEASLVVANTPDELILYDAFALSSEVSAGLDYSFTLSGATVST